jgi:hypothetical protein
MGKISYVYVQKIRYLYNENQQDALFTFSFIPTNNLYTFRSGVLIIIMRYYFVYTATGICHAFIPIVVYTE